MTSTADRLDVPATSPEGRAASVVADDPPRTRGVGLAIGGRPAAAPAPPEAPEWADAAPAWVPSEEFDGADLGVVNRELNACRVRLFRVSQALMEAQREYRRADLAYSRAMRRALISTSGGTAETRRAVAEIECEPLENDVAVKAQIVEELRRRAQDVRDDLKAVENISHNVRAQMDLR